MIRTGTLFLYALAASCGVSSGPARVTVVGGAQQTIRIKRLAGEEVPITLWNHGARDAVVSKVQSSCGCATLNLEKGKAIAALSKETFKLLISVNVGEERLVALNIEFEGGYPPVRMRLKVVGPLDNGAEFDRERLLVPVDYHRATVFHHEVRFATHSADDFDEIAEVGRWYVERGPEVELVSSEVMRSEKVLRATFRLTPKYLGEGSAIVALLLRKARIPTLVRWVAESEYGLPDIVVMQRRGGGVYAQFTLPGNEGDNLRCIESALQEALKCRIEWHLGKWRVEVEGDQSWTAGKTVEGALELTADSWGRSARVSLVVGL